MERERQRVVSAMHTTTYDSTEPYTRRALAISESRGSGARTLIAFSAWPPPPPPCRAFSSTGTRYLGQPDRRTAALRMSSPSRSGRGSEFTTSRSPATWGGRGTVAWSSSGRSLRRKTAGCTFQLRSGSWAGPRSGPGSRRKRRTPLLAAVLGEAASARVGSDCLDAGTRSTPSSRHCDQMLPAAGAVGGSTPPPTAWPQAPGVNRGVINKSMMLMLYRTVYDYEPIARVRWNK